MPSMLRDPVLHPASRGQGVVQHAHNGRTFYVFDM